MVTREEIFEEFSMSKYACRSDRDIALADEIVFLRNLINSGFKDSELIAKIDAAIFIAKMAKGA